MFVCFVRFLHVYPFPNLDMNCMMGVLHYIILSLESTQIYLSKSLSGDCCWEHDGEKKISSWAVWNLIFWNKHSFPSHHHKRALWAHDSHQRSWCHVCLWVFVHVWISVSSLKWQVSCVPYGRVRAKLTPRLTTVCGLLLSPTEGKDCVTSTGCWTKTAAKPMGCFSGLLDISVHRLGEKVPFQTNSNLLAWGWVRFVNSTLQKWKKIDFFRRTMKQKHKLATYNQTVIDHMLLNLMNMVVYKSDGELNEQGHKRAVGLLGKKEVHWVWVLLYVAWRTAHSQQDRAERWWGEAWQQ